MQLLAIDFETGTEEIASACAVGLVLGDAHRIEREFYSLVRPPRHAGWFSQIHHIEWEDVEDQPSFADLWPEMAPFFETADVLIAHKAKYDKQVLAAMCEEADLPVPDKPWVCTLHLSQAMWTLPTYRLDALAAHFGLVLEPHNARSDATAALKLVQQALADGGHLANGLLKKSDKNRLPPED